MLSDLVLFRLVCYYFAWFGVVLFCVFYLAWCYNVLLGVTLSGLVLCCQAWYYFVKLGVILYGLACHHCAIGHLQVEHVRDSRIYQSDADV